MSSTVVCPVDRSVFAINLPGLYESATVARSAQDSELTEWVAAVGERDNVICGQVRGRAADGAPGLRCDRLPCSLLMH